MSLTSYNPPTNDELNLYKTMAIAAASNPQWRKVAGDDNKDRPMTPEQVIGGIFSVMLLAREIGIPPMQAVAWGIYNVRGKLEISARGMNQLIRQRGHTLKIKVATNEYCQIWAKRKDTGEEWTESFTFEEARIAGLTAPSKTGKPGAWQTATKDMLFARCLSRLARRLFADCIGGFYIEGELRETVLKETVDSIDVSVMQEIEQAPEPEVILSLPEDVDPEEVAEFINENAVKRNLTASQIKVSANNNMAVFIERFHKWNLARVAA